MGLIKSNHAPAALTPFSMKDVEDQARAMLLAARRTAERLLVEAQKEADDLRVQAHTQGLEDGRQEGLDQGRAEGQQTGLQQALAQHGAELTAAAAALADAMRHIEEARMSLEADALQDVVELAIAVARRVTKRQGQIDPLVLTENLREAMRLVVHASDVRVVIHPDQRAVLDGALPGLGLEFPQLTHVTIVEDPQITPGGCRVLTGGGRVDADLDAQLDRVVADLLPSPTEPEPGP